MEMTKEQIEQFQLDVRKNARLISNFCELMGMSPIEAGASAEFFSICVTEVAGIGD